MATFTDINFNEGLANSLMFDIMQHNANDQELQENLKKRK